MPNQSLTFHMPAEWEPHKATWLAWPFNIETWPEKYLAEVQDIWWQMIQHLSLGEEVHVLANDRSLVDSTLLSLRASAKQSQIHFHQILTNDAWIRDYGPIFVQGPHGKTILDFGFNRWGGKYPDWQLDNQVPSQVSSLLGLPRVDGQMILEGGSIEVNGKGFLLTTEQCLLNPNRNPQLSKAAIETRLKNFFGANTIGWLPAGIAGDDTDGHIDDLARFVNASTIIAVAEEDPSDENYKILQENLRVLKSLRDVNGKPFEIVTLPMPAPIEDPFVKGRLPASYANFYIGNAVVLAPIFNDKNDERVLTTLRKFFPTREVIGINCSKVVVGLGAFHCVTQQEPI
ncbi:MAG: agmatine deiminase family protein [Deltaproteobacteria bacterium]|nr:agmatine deiminase family protein [Deltaproteobacteria bacterium]